MERERRLRIYDLHSWSGITLGWFVYVVCITGCFALFEREIVSWEDPARRIPASDERARMHPALEAFVEEASDGDHIRFVTFTFANEVEPYHAARVGVRSESRNDTHHRRWDPRTAQTLAAHETGLSRWLLEIHRSLSWPKSLGGFRTGRTLVGLSGAILMLSLLSGLILHTKRSAFFVLRADRSDRLRWQDTHKTLGLWGLPFFAMIALTGTILGFNSVLTPAAAVIAYGGDPAAMEAAISRPTPAETGTPASMFSIDRFAREHHPRTAAAPAHVHFARWGDAAAVATLRYPVEGRLATFDRLAYDAVTGELLAEHPTNQPVSATLRLYSTVTPLHFGTFGGPSLKWLYLLLGGLLAGMCMLGNAMWIARRTGPHGEPSPAQYRLVRANLGIALGFPLATIVSFHADKLLFGEGGSPYAGIGAVYLATLALALGYAFIRSSRDAATAELLRACGALCVAIPLVNGFASGEFMPVPWAGHWEPHDWVDASLFAVGLATLALTPGVTGFAERTSRSS